MTKLPRRPLPGGIQTFREIREGNYYYVDKTAYAGLMEASGFKHWFLSRPRRFGKSLFVDTLKELFEGNEALFRGLAIHDEWDWSARHPVLRLDFSQGNFKSPGRLQRDTMNQLKKIESAAGLSVNDEDDAGLRCRNLIEALHESTGQRVVFLVDEYDNPILDALDQPEIAAANRDFLRGLYGTLKISDAHIRLSFLTGVSKFSKVNLFSGLNQLRDITLSRDYSAICGYTETDLTTVFAPELAAKVEPEDEVLDLDRIRDWYNGYCWLGSEAVYNPYGILLLFAERRFAPWWFETGTPEFLVRFLRERPIRRINLEQQIESLELLSKFDVGDIAPEALLFQVGYLTIAKTEAVDGKTLYSLGYPNREVRESLNRFLLETMLEVPLNHGVPLARAVAAGDAGALETRIRLLFDAVPHQWHANNPMSQYEGWYASTMLAYFNCYGYDIRVADSSNQSRADMVLEHPDVTWIFEFKVVKRAGRGDALAQIRKRGYADKYRDGRRIILVGAEFSQQKRNLVRFEAAEA